MNRDRILGRLPPSTMFLILALSIPLVVALLWGDITADSAYAHFRAARLIARGQWEGFPPLYPLLLAPASRIGLPLSSIAAGLSVLGWAVAIAGWLATGRALGKTAFSLAAAGLLALHPLQGDVLGLETGLVLGLTAVLVWGAVKIRRPRFLPVVGLGIGSLCLVALWPPALALVVPALACRLIRRSRAPSLAGVALGAASYVLVALLIGTWRTPHSLALLIVAVQVLAAAGFARLAPRFEELFRSPPARGALGRSLVVVGLALLIVWQVIVLVQGWRLRPVDQLVIYRETAAWLVRNTLPDETIATEHPGLLGYLTNRPTLGLPPAAPAASLLDEIDRLRPDLCVTLNSIPWQGVTAQPWFQSRYERVYETDVPYDAVAPVVVFLHRPSPFDAGEFVSATVPFASDGEGWVALTGYRVQSRQISPGDSLHATLHWRALTDLPEPLSLVLRLRDPATGEVWARVRDAAPGGLPTDVWNVDEEMVARYVLEVPRDLPPGEYALELTLVRPNGSELVAPDREAPGYVFATLTRPPVASDAAPSPEHALGLTFGDAIALVGYDVPERVAPGDGLRVVLYWHALENVPRDYKVFVHLLGPDGHPLAQDDSVPAGWTYPTTSWQAGEFIRDEHVLEIDASIPIGDYALSAGMYDPETAERLTVLSSEGEALGDQVVLQEVRVR